VSASRGKSETPRPAGGWLWLSELAVGDYCRLVPGGPVWTFCGGRGSDAAVSHPEHGTKRVSARRNVLRADLDGHANAGDRALARYAAERERLGEL
jgi:hypothetical protein